MKRLSLLSLVLIGFSANAAIPLKEERSQPVRARVTKPQLAKHNWSEVFVLKNGTSRIRHTPSMIYVDNIPTRAVNLRTKAYKGIPISRAGLRVHVGMSRDEFVRALLRSGLYVPAVSNWSDRFVLKNGNTILRTPYWIDYGPAPLTRRLSIKAGADTELPLKPQGLTVHIGMSKNEFVQTLIRSGVYTAPKKNPRNAKNLWFECFPLKNGAYAIHFPDVVSYRDGKLAWNCSRLWLEDIFINNKKISNLRLSYDMTRSQFMQALQRANLYYRPGIAPPRSLFSIKMNHCIK